MDSKKDQKVGQDVFISQKNGEIDSLMQTTIRKLGLTGRVDENDIEAYYFCGPWHECWSPCTPCPRYSSTPPKPCQTYDPCYSSCRPPLCSTEKRYPMTKNDLRPVDTGPIPPNYFQNHPQKITRKLRAQRVAKNKRVVKRQESTASTANTGNQYALSEGNQYGLSESNQTNSPETSNAFTGTERVSNAFTGTENTSQRSFDVQTDNTGKEQKAIETQRKSACQCHRRFVAAATRNVLPMCSCVKSIQASAPTANKYTCTCCLAQVKKAQHSACNCRLERDSTDDARYEQNVRQSYCRPRVICGQVENHDSLYKLLNDTSPNMRSYTNLSNIGARDIICKVGNRKQSFGSSPCNLICLTHFTNKVLTSRSEYSIFSGSEISNQGDYNMSNENIFNRHVGNNISR